MLATITSVPSCSSTVILDPPENITGPNLVNIVISPLDAGDVLLPPLSCISKTELPVPTPVLSSCVSNWT